MLCPNDTQMFCPLANVDWWIIIIIMRLIVDSNKKIKEAGHVFHTNDFDNNFVFCHESKHGFKNVENRHLEFQLCLDEHYSTPSICLTMILAPI